LEGRGTRLARGGGERATARKGRREAPKRVAAKGGGGAELRSTTFNMVDLSDRRFPRRSRLAGISGPGPCDMLLVVHGVSDDLNSKYIGKVKYLVIV
jgi:hypothetical protein